MRTTIDVPDSVFREIKALAALRGVSLKRFILDAVESAKNNPPAAAPVRLRTFRPIHLRSGRKLSLKGFDFDNLLA